MSDPSNFSKISKDEQLWRFVVEYNKTDEKLHLYWAEHPGMEEAYWRDINKMFKENHWIIP